MKRVYRRKLRDRRVGQSPYARYNKAPYLYSPAYYSWLNQFKKHKPDGAAPSTREYRRAA